MSSETPNTSHSRSSKLTRAFMIVPLFFFLNIALSLMNRYALGHLGFKFPLILTAFHALFSFLSMMPIAVRTHESRMKYYQVIKSEWKGVSYVGFWLSVNIALNNLSLVYIDLGLNQIIRYGSYSSTCFCLESIGSLNHLSSKTLIFLPTTSLNVWDD